MQQLHIRFPAEGRASSPSASQGEKKFHVLQLLKYHTELAEQGKGEIGVL